MQFPLTKKKVFFFSFITWNISHSDKELICFMWDLGARIFSLHSKSDRLWHSTWSAKTKLSCKSSYNTACRILCSIHIQMLISNKIIFLWQVLILLIQTVRNRPSFSVLKKGEVTESMRVCYYFKILPLLTKYFEAREFTVGFMQCWLYSVIGCSSEYKTSSIFRVSVFCEESVSSTTHLPQCYDPTLLLAAQ